MSTIGGHERDALIWALKHMTALENGHTLATTRDRLFGKQARRNAVDSTKDLTQLTTLLKAATPLLVDATSEDGSIVLCYHVGVDLAHRTVDMPEARRVLLGLLTSENHFGGRRD